MFEEINFFNISQTLIEMNGLLQGFLIQSREINKNTESLLINKVFSYMDYVRTGCEEGKSLQQLLNENLANNMMLAINMKKINESDLSISEKLSKSIEYLLHQSLSYKEHFYNYYYSVLFKIL